MTNHQRLMASRDELEKVAIYKEAIDPVALGGLIAATKVGLFNLGMYFGSKTKAGQRLGAKIFGRGIRAGMRQKGIFRHEVPRWVAAFGVPDVVKLYEAGLHVGNAARKRGISEVDMVLFLRHPTDESLRAVRNEVHRSVRHELRKVAPVVSEALGIPPHTAHRVADGLAEGAGRDAEQFMRGALEGLTEGVAEHYPSALKAASHARDLLRSMAWKPW